MPKVIWQNVVQIYECMMEDVKKKSHKLLCINTDRIHGETCFLYRIKKLELGNF